VDSTGFCVVPVADAVPGSRLVSMTPKTTPASSVEETPASTKKVDKKYYEKELERCRSSSSSSRSTSAPKG
jgi:hypothetical protein